MGYFDYLHFTAYTDTALGSVGASSFSKTNLHEFSYHRRAKSRSMHRCSFFSISLRLYPLLKLTEFTVCQELDQGSSTDTQETETTRGCAGLQWGVVGWLKLIHLEGASATAPVINLLGPSWVAGWGKKLHQMHPLLMLIPHRKLEIKSFLEEEF